MNELEFIKKNAPSLLLDRRVMSLIGGGWRLQEDDIDLHATPRNIEFWLTLVKDSRCVRLSAKINRATGKFSNIEAQNL